MVENSTWRSREASILSPQRLAVFLNYSVFLYEIQGQPEAACKVAKNVFDESIDALDPYCPEDREYQGAVYIMQMIRDNLTLWTSDEYVVYSKTEGLGHFCRRMNELMTCNNLKNPLKQKYFNYSLTTQHSYPLS
jgi:hypothetical protein